MDTEALVAMLAAAVALMGSPGPATLSIAATSAVFGVRGALPYFCGVCCGTSTIVLLVGTGVTGLILAVPGVAPVLIVLAAGYILYLAYRIATAAPLKSRSEAGPAPQALPGYLFAVANPKGYAAIGAVFAGFVLVNADPARDALLKAAILIAIVVVVNVSWLLTGRVLAQVFKTPTGARVLNVTFAALLVLSVVVLAI